MKQTMEEVHLTTIKPRNEVLLLAQEISFAKVLSCNDKRLRDRGIRRLKKWFLARSQGSSDFTKDDFMRIWKGLFYCMWMSDKLLIQEELAEQISNLVHSFASFKCSLLFVETFFASLSIEWFGIDQLRLDKFMMLVRRFMRQSLELVARLKWPKKQTQNLADVYLKTLKTAPMGLSMHVIEIFCEELAKVGKGALSSSTILQFITLFAHHLATLKDGRLISQITRYVFLHLIRQTELGVEHQMKFSAWKEYGFPGGDVDAAEKIEVEPESDEELIAGSEDDDEEERLTGDDARAGKVDVVLPPLDFDYRDLLKVLRDLRNSKETTTKARKTLMQLITKYEKLIEGKYPLGIHKIDLAEKIDKKKEITKAAKRICIEEDKLMSDGSGTDESDCEKMLLSKKTAKRIAKKKIKSNWTVSKVNFINKQNKESKVNSSWSVNESNDTDDTKLNTVKKRKKNEDENELSILNKKAKKSKKNSYSLSDNKENSCASSPVENAAKVVNKKNTVKQTSSNNRSPDDNLHTPNKKEKKLKKSKNTITNTSTSEQKGDVDLVESDEAKTDTTPTRKSNRTNKGEKETVIIIKESEKNNGWGGEWDEPVNDVAYEIFVPNKKYVEKRKLQGLSYPVSSIVQSSAKKTSTPVSVKNKCTTPGSQKKVEFNLSANCSQEYKEYERKLKRRTSEVAFDASKKPSQGLLKNNTPSPINPFYKKKLKFLTSPMNKSFS